MPDNTDRPFDHDTLKLRAVFVPEDAKDQVSQVNITRALGYDAVKIPAVFVPEGGKPPGFPYEYVGRVVFNPTEAGGGRRVFTTGPSSSQASDLAREDGAPGPTLPRTRYRFGAAWSGSRHRPPPPNPALGRGQGSPVATGIAMWCGMAHPGNVLRRSQAAAGPTREEQGGRVSVAATGVAEPAASSSQVDAVRDPGTPVGQPMPQASASPPRSDSGAAERRLQHARVQAFLRLIRSAENQDEGDRESDYHKLVGDRPGSSGSIARLDHYPDRMVRQEIGGSTTESSAVGAYQITEHTWHEAVASLAAEGVSVGDFSAPSQDRVAEQIIQEHQALDLVRAGKMEQAVARLRGTWVSLPGGVEQAPGLDMTEARRRFDQYVAGYSAR